MWNPFKKKRKADVRKTGLPADYTIWSQEWVRSELPDPGAMNFAFTSLDLPLQTPIGAGVAVRHPYVPTQRGAQPYYPVQNVALQGIGQVSGTVRQQPLFNPRFPNYGGLLPLTSNDAMPRAEIIPAGSSIQ